MYFSHAFQAAASINPGWSPFEEALQATTCSGRPRPAAARQATCLSPALHPSGGPGVGAGASNWAALLLWTSPTGLLHDWPVERLRNLMPGTVDGCEHEGAGGPPLHATGEAEHAAAAAAAGGKPQSH
eukprot:SM000009S23589  [mRNA]  locus=s9:920907:921534:- [translate_table: standard]